MENENEPQGVGKLHAVYVHPSFVRNGIGSALMTEAEAGLAEAGYATAGLWVFTENRLARKVYERLGWSDTGRLNQLEIGEERWYEKRLGQV